MKDTTPMKRLLSIALLLSLCTLAACQEKKSDAILHKWTGPEGTFLEVTRAEDAYTVTVQNLDGPRTFPATLDENDNITFERDGKTETIAMVDGDGTGMKWLAGKTNCIMIEKGEGYCRD